MELISFVIPCYRSQETIEKVVIEIEDTMKNLEDYSHEIILVNDSSPDNTFQVVKEICSRNKNCVGLDFARNFGQHSALMAGLRHSRGDIVVCLDDDGQTPADEVGKLLDKLKEGSDVVYAKYESKKHSAFRNFGSLINERMARALIGKPKELYVSSYFAAKRFIDDMIRYENSYPYVIGLVLRATNNISNVMVNHREREVGTSGYTLSKLFGLWFNGFTAFSVKPLRLATVTGFISAMIGFLYGIYTIIKRFIIPDIPAGYSATMAVILFMGGMLMIMLGLVGEYVGRVYISINNAPQYVIKEVVGGEEDESNKQK
jgi:undecaprenyl-phosphate 4-deoxy-4-formamido-L-arabinose transferase